MTITSAANPLGLTVGGYVTITGVSNTGYTGFYVVTAIPNGTTFQYTDVTSGLGAATGGYAAASTAETPITSVSESGSTVTVTSPVNPSGLIVGDTVTIAGVVIGGYNGIFNVTAVPNGTTFQYNDTSASGLAASSGGFATANTAQCGLVDSVAQLLNNGQVLVAGGDYIVFLGQSSPQAFLFNPATPGFSQTGAMNVARELPAMTLLPSGNVLVAGGLTGEAAACAPTPSTPVDFTTNFSAEIYNSTLGTWALTPGSSATPGATGGMSVQRIASGELFTTGPDAGLVILAGGTSAVTTNGTVPNFGTCVATTAIHQITKTATDLFDEHTGLFTPTGTLSQSRGGYGYGFVGSQGDLVVVGGECANNSLASAAIGTVEAYNACDGGTGPHTAQNDYYELYNQASGTWTLGTNNPSWFTPATITSISESGTTATVTMATANPVGLALAAAL